MADPMRTFVLPNCTASSKSCDMPILSSSDDASSPSAVPTVSRKLASVLKSSDSGTAPVAAGCPIVINPTNSSLLQALATCFARGAQSFGSHPDFFSAGIDLNHDFEPIDPLHGLARFVQAIGKFRIVDSFHHP